MSLEERKESVTIPESTKIVTVAVIIRCDLCGTVADYKTPEGHAAWEGSDGVYKSELVIVERRSETDYRDSGETRRSIFDICPKCWDSKIVT